MKIKRLTAFALAIASLAGTAPVTGIVKPQSSICAAETKFEKTGKCGENVTYELSDDGTLNQRKRTNVQLRTSCYPDIN